MPLGYEYKRYFIILQEEEKGYEIIGGKIPTGYVKVEIKKGKAKVTGFIQNMIWDEKSEYKMVLLAPKPKVALDFGRFRMDNNGRGEFYCELDSDNVLGSGIEITEFEAALVASGSRVPLFGYTGKDKVDWREWYNKKEEIIKEEPEEKMPPYDVMEEIVEEEPEEEIPPYDVIEEIIEEEPEEEAPPHDVMEEMPYIHYFHDVNVGGIPESEYGEGNIYKRLTKALRNLDEFNGFEESGKHRWYVVGNKLRLLNSVIINLNGAMMPLSYPYIVEGYSPWIKHCILGVEYDDGEINKVLIGIPGAYKSQCKPCFSYKGFTGYKKSKKGKMGYWIMCIDIEKGILCKI